MNKFDDNSQCEGLIDYLVGMGSDMERKRFERHLAECGACRKEEREMREVWDRLREDAEPAELPADLKEVVLRPLIGDKSDNAASRTGKKTFFAGFVPWIAGIAVASLFFFAGWMASNATGSSANNEAAGLPASDEIEKIYRLAAHKDNGMFEGRPRAYGLACLVRSQQEERLVVYVFDTPSTEGSQAYQVWLKIEGREQSAGTFAVDESGIGILTLPYENETDIQAIGVTLEQDTSSDTPKGIPMFGDYEEG